MISTGIEIVDVKKIAALIEKKPEYLGRFFCSSEIVHCSGYRERAVHLAGCLAAKLAFKKASPFFTGFDIHNLEIKHTSEGKPYIVCMDTRLKGYSISVSISHTKSVAAGLCVISKNGKICSSKKKEGYT